MKSILILSFILLLTSITSAQGIIKNQEGFKVVDLEGITFLPETTEYAKGLYWLNNRLIDSVNYQKYLNNDKKFAGCNPCLLRSFDSQGRLIYEGFQFSDCGVGQFVSYFDNGKPRLVGFYKQNTSKDWTNIVKRGYCSIADSVWTFFNESGEVQYKEYWDRDTFIKQVPEQDTNEVWRVALMIGDVEIKKDDSLSLEDFRNLRIVPLFKNKSVKGTALFATLRISAVNRFVIDSSGLLEQIRTFDISKMKHEAGITDGDRVSYSLYIKSGQKVVAAFFLNIK